MAPRKSKADAAGGTDDAAMVLDYLRRQKCVCLLLIRWILADLESAQSSLLGAPEAPHALYHILTDTTTFQAIEVSANLHNKVSKAQAAKHLQKLHQDGQIEGRVSGKQTVYHTLQDTSDTSIADTLASLEQEKNQLQEELHALKATEKEARAGLAAFEARPRLTGIRHGILQLENERDAIQARLAELDGADAVQVSLAEREALDQEWNRWQQHAAVRRRICRELWGICSEVLPEGMTAPELWVSASRQEPAGSNRPDMRGRALPVPSGQPVQNGHSRNPSGLDMARSPPNPGNKNTKHVPCKFFRQGACQAGPACPFLHSTDSAVDYAPCKYFTKGNCKFGAKCALAHILPDGRRVNRPTGGMSMGGSHLNLGGRVNPQTYVNQDSALTNSVLSQQRMNGHEPRYAQQEDFPALHGQQQPNYDTIPTIDAGLASDPGSKYGSPVDDVRFPMSPNHHHLTALDAPLPASFDSQGISHAARYGPVAASVPSKFGVELSPPAQRPAFVQHRIIPPAPDDTIGPRFLHSSRPVKPRMLSASVPRPAALDDWAEGDFPMEEDYLPINLHDDVLTPQEKLRRLSRTDHDLSSSHRDMSGLGMTSSSFSKNGSPLASSPSRFGALFAKQRQKKEDDTHVSSYPHIGSPLRESSLNPIGSPSLGPIGSRTSHDGSPFVSSPGRQSSMSMISEQLSGMSLHPGPVRHSSGNGPSSSGRLDRSMASPLPTSKIDEEEQSDLVFSMEEEEGNKRNSASWNSDTKEDSAA
ncbi:hypothetical protein N7510_001003 [Penicillium lagena]|uniref:uncharacterized protein n=1 Tax=Penicillium lagena TaxID=94218 RepID=UPI002540397B|nr:uncharacterized protein N7510_001003 [Penicillium lagena]KAJ5624694.1 hypothetical protein N7510_001003 [Penicillium lagena]